ncbi:hypothetical protein [Methylobacterium sp. R2-1]|uniref:hypothetical protein n=1 Tax=Methylobacterium sp. R2-1 TaxID=2587064 RepID=UPI00161883EF|nr:hypothetical protein [Methylobacterium sp. R2-1]MBB2965172.1 hypothetical protein [Methylobacterium sp. R2-1]
MGKKKDLRRARQEMEAERPSDALLPLTPRDDDGKLKAVSILVTKTDHRRLRGLALSLDNLHLQGLGTRALNAFLESHGQPRLTPVRQGKRSAQETD